MSYRMYQRKNKVYQHLLHILIMNNMLLKDVLKSWTYTSLHDEFLANSDTKPLFPNENNNNAIIY